MLLFALMLACRSDALPGEAEFAAASKPEAAAPTVTFADGTQLLSSTVTSQAKAGEEVVISAVFSPETPGPDLQWEAQLWGAGVSEPAATWRGDTPTWPGEVVRFDFRPTLPADIQPGNYWLQWRLRHDGDPLQAEPFRSGRVSLGVIRVGAPPLEPVPTADVEGPVLAVGGDTSVARRMHVVAQRVGYRTPLAAGLPALAEADLAYVNLECAVGVGGEQGVEKGEKNPFYYRARPEMLGLLTTAGVDVVGTANNHAGDYGLDLLAAQDELLASVGISSTGSGPAGQDACAPVFRKAGGLTVAFVSVDTTMPYYAASRGKPGICYADIGRPGALVKRLQPALREARGQADLVFVGIHWGANRKPRPTAAARRAGRALIEAGVDGVLGSSAHSLQGIEVHQGRPILYDTGNLLFDSLDGGEMLRGGLFELTLDPRGVRQLRVTPLDVTHGRTQVATSNSAARTLLRLRDLSAEFGTATRFDGEQLVVDLPEPRPRSRPANPAPSDAVGEVEPAPAVEPAPGCLVDAVPEDAAMEPTPANGLVLLGARLETDTIPDRRGVWLQSWWRLPDDKPVRSRMLTTRVNYEEPSEDTLWNADHEPCDWGWPTDRWVPGAIYRDRTLLRPRPTLPEGRYDVTLGGVHVGSIRKVP